MNKYRVSLRTAEQGYTMFVTAKTPEAAEITALATLELDRSEVVNIITSSY